MKTGLIEKRIKKERKKILKEKYDVEVAFKDGFTALFTAFGNSKKKVKGYLLFGTKKCPNCEIAKKKLNEKNVDVEELKYAEIENDNNKICDK